MNKKVTVSPAFRNTCIVILLLVVSSLSCEKKIVEKNPFTDITTLDCRNLVIRKVELKNSIIEVSMENSCKNCEDGWVYLGMVMISRSNEGDTLARTPCLNCLGCPRNGETKVYQLQTSLTSLPDLKNVKFNFDYLCMDVTYLPK